MATLSDTAFVKEAPAKKIKKGLVKYNKKYTLRYKDFAKQFKQAIPVLGKTKLGHLEKFIAGTSKGGTLFTVIFIGTIDTAKWAMDEKSEAVDLWAVWGIAAGKALATVAGYELGVMFATGVGTMLGMTTGLIVLTVGVGIVGAALLAYAVGTLLDSYRVQENLQNFLRDIEFIGITGITRNEKVSSYYGNMVED